MQISKRRGWCRTWSAYLHGFEEPPNFIPHVGEGRISQLTRRQDIVVVKPCVILHTDSFSANHLILYFAAAACKLGKRQVFGRCEQGACNQVDRQSDTSKPVFVEGMRADLLVNCREHIVIVSFVVFTVIIMSC